MSKYRVRRFRRPFNECAWGAFTADGGYIWGTSGHSAEETMQRLLWVLENSKTGEPEDVAPAGDIE